MSIVPSLEEGDDERHFGRREILPVRGDFELRTREDRDGDRLLARLHQIEIEMRARQGACGSA